VNVKTPNLGPRITVLNQKGERICRFGGRFAGDGPGRLIAPHAITGDSRGDLYVAEVSYTFLGLGHALPVDIRCFKKFRRTE
jgi:hypothetical protein